MFGLSRIARDAEQAKAATATLGLAEMSSRLLPKAVAEGPLGPLLTLHSVTDAIDVLSADREPDFHAALDDDEELKLLWKSLVAWSRARAKALADRIYRESRDSTATSSSTPSGRKRETPAPIPEWKPPRIPATKKARRASITEKELQKRQRAAKGLLRLVFAVGAASKLSLEMGSDEAGKGEWGEEFVQTLVGGDSTPGHEHGTLQRALSTFTRWATWLRKQSEETYGGEFNPMPIAMARFFSHISKNGPTAASGAFKSFEFLVRHLRLCSLPLHAAIVARWKVQAAGHAPEQVMPLPTPAYGLLADLIFGGSGGCSWETILAALIVRYLVSCLRYAHADRATRVPEQCTIRTEIWSISRGKAGDRHGYKVSCPTHCGPKQNYTLLLNDQLDQDLHDLESQHFLLPDVEIPRDGVKGKCRFLDARMPRGKMIAIAGALMGAALPTALKTYMIRRFLPSVAGGIQLPLEDKRDLGNWQDCVQEQGSTARVSEPMCVRYSQTRLEASAAIKRLCLGLLNHMLSKVTNPTWDDVVRLTPSVGIMKSNIANANWGRNARDRLEHQAIPLVVEDAESSISGDSASSEDSESEAEGAAENHEGRAEGNQSTPATPPKLPTMTAEGDDEEGEVTQEEMEAVPWLIPGFGTLIHVRRPEEQAKSGEGNTPLCRDGAFVYGYETGEGLANAGLPLRTWCKPCLRKLQPSMPALVKLILSEEQTAMEPAAPWADGIDFNIL